MQERHGVVGRPGAVRSVLRKTIGALAMACVATALSAAPAYAATEPTTTVPLAPVNNNPGLNLGGAGLAIFVAIIIGVLVVLLFAPVVYSALLLARAQRRQEKFARSLLERTKPGWRNRSQELPPAPPPHSADDFVKILDAYQRLSAPATVEGQGPLGQGVTTTLIALAILTLVGVALVVVLVSSSTDAGDLRKTIITALLSILASISGFYFGSRTAQDAAKQAQSGSDGQSSVPVFKLAQPPDSVKAGDNYFYRFEAIGSPPPRYELGGNAPQWLTVDSATGTVSGIPKDAGSFEYSVVAANSQGSTSTRSFPIRVDAASP